MNTVKDPNAVALGRKGGLKGGKARAAKMTPKELSDFARKAALARWKKKGTGQLVEEAIKISKSTKETCLAKVEKVMRLTISGPAASGKTILARKLVTLLEREGYKVKRDVLLGLNRSEILMVEWHEMIPECDRAVSDSSKRTE